MSKATIILAALASIAVTTPTLAAKPPETWDGLVRQKAKRMNLVYVQPGADFRGYSKVMFDPIEVAFQKNWKKDYNSSRRDLGGRVTDQEIEKAVSAGITASTDIFAKAWEKGGYAVVTAPGPDVLRVQVGIVNISVSAPDRMTAGRSYTFSDTAGHATFFIEARDSDTGALLGRAVDQQVAGDSTMGWRSSVGNRADFRAMVERWASVSVRGMAELKALSPVAQ